MEDGEEWKLQEYYNERNNPENVALDEYSSIIKAHFENVLRPIIQGGKELDRVAVKLVKSDLELKLQDPSFRNLPLKLQDAYKTFKNFVEILGESNDQEIREGKDALNGIFNLATCCMSFGDTIHAGEKGLYYNRNPCRSSQYMADSVIIKSLQRYSSKLLDAARQMSSICLICPYRPEKPK